MKRVFLMFIAYLFILGTAYAEEPLDHKSGQYYTILDVSTGQVIFETGMSVEVDDQILTDDNKFYQVSSVNGYTAYARYIQNETYSFEELVRPTADAASPGKLFSIYHSHTDESYTPTDGKPSIRGKGSIMKVGDAFADKLTSMGYRVSHSTALHDPHDANAYIRSRRTAAKLLSEQPTAMFDVHRDSAPVSAYRLTLEGQQVARIVIVVGRANVYQLTTLDFAKKLKAAADSIHPKLVRGIFFARGHYNQDLAPRAILLEVGTEGSTLEEAQRGIVMFADVIPSVLGGPQDPTPIIGSTAQAAPPGSDGAVSDNGNNAAWLNVFWLVGITAVASIAFLYISTGSWHGVRQKLYHLRNIEFANLLGLRFRRKKNDDSNEE